MLAVNQPRGNSTHACVVVEFDRGFVRCGHLVGDGGVGGGGEVEALEVLAAGRVPASGVGVRGQRRDERAAHGAERLHLRRVHPVRVPLALPPAAQERVAPRRPPATTAAAAGHRRRLGGNHLLPLLAAFSHRHYIARAARCVSVKALLLARQGSSSARVRLLLLPAGFLWRATLCCDELGLARVFI